MEPWVILKETGEYRNREKSKEINQQISDKSVRSLNLKTIRIGFAKLVQGKIILRKIAEETIWRHLTLLNPEIVDEIKNGKI
jgi:hypothetical protein